MRTCREVTVVSKLITDGLFSEDNELQLQIQNRAARRINFHYRNRSVGISAEIFLITDTDALLISN